MDRLRYLFGKRLRHHGRARGWSVFFTRPSVLIAGLDLSAKVIKEGSFADVDLTLLAVDQNKLPISLQMRRLSICEIAPWPGEPVIVAIPESTASRALCRRNYCPRRCALSLVR